MRQTAAVLSDSVTTEGPRDSSVSIFRRFLKFGALAWGGPAAQIAMIKHECVDEEHWVDEETFTKTLAVYQVLPGPEAHELCVYFGRLRGGKLGAFLAGLGFMLPGFLLMLGLSVLYVEAGLDERLVLADPACPRGGGRGRRHPLAHRRDLPRGPEGGARHLRRRLLGD